MRTSGQLGGARLAEDLAARVEQDGERLRAAELVERRRDRLRPEDHARAPAVGRVVDAPMPARGPSAAGRGPGSRRGRAPASGPGCSRTAGPRPSPGRGRRRRSRGSWRRPRPRLAGRSAAGVASPASGFAPLPWRDQRGRRRCRAAPPARRVDRRRAEVQHRLVDDDLAALRREGRDDRRGPRARRTRPAGPPRTT